MIFLLHNIKKGATSNYDSPEKVEAAMEKYPDAIYTFDGVYKSVWYKRRLLAGRKVILFIVGGWVGGDNRADDGQPLEYLCSWDHLIKLTQYFDCELGWHTWTHPDLTQLSDEDIQREITPPTWLHMKSFAYPYGKFDERVEQIVAQQYDRAYTAGKGDNTPYQVRRRHL